MIFRLEPRGPVQAYKTYGISSPPATHSRPATCAEIECEAWANGWVTRVPAASELAEYIASGVHGRTFREITGFSALGAAEREFMFPPGQSCFRTSEHRVSLERPPLFVVRDGDHRGNPTGRSRTHVRPADWVEDFAEHQQMVRNHVERG